MGPELVIGTDEADDLSGTFGDDIIRGLGGDDRISGGAGNDTISGEVGEDVLKGGAGDDAIQGGRGNDRILGGGGNDGLFGGDGDDEVFGGAGNDQLSGGFGTNQIDGGDGNDTVTYAIIGFSMVVTLGVDGEAGSASITGPAPDSLEDTLVGIEHVVGTDADDSIFGNEADNRLFGLGDVDAIDGGDGNDRITGGARGDQLTGGAGADRFVARLAADLAGDEIVDFSQEDGDRIVLRAIDPLPATPENDAFEFIGSDAITFPGQVRYQILAGVTQVQVAVADGLGLVQTYQFELRPILELTAADFVLEREPTGYRR